MTLTDQKMIDECRATFANDLVRQSQSEWWIERLQEAIRYGLRFSERQAKIELQNLLWQKQGG